MLSNNKGLGRAFAEIFLKAGARICLSDVNAEASTIAIAKTIMRESQFTSMKKENPSDIKTEPLHCRCFTGCIMSGWKVDNVRVKRALW